MERFGHQGELQCGGGAGAGIAAHVEDDGLSGLKFAKVRERLGLGLDAVKRRNLNIGDSLWRQPAAFAFGSAFFPLLVVGAVDDHLPPVIQSQRKALGKDRRGIKEADSGVTIAGSGNIFAMGGEELVDGRAVDPADHGSCVYAVDDAAYGEAVTVDRVSDEANRLTVGLIQPF